MISVRNRPLTLLHIWNIWSSSAGVVTIFAIIRKITILAFEAKETSTGDVIGAST